jgi:hypothetical protein
MPVKTFRTIIMIGTPKRPLTTGDWRYDDDRVWALKITSWSHFNGSSKNESPHFPCVTWLGEAAVTAETSCRTTSTPKWTSPKTGSGGLKTPNTATL